MRFILLAIFLAGCGSTGVADKAKEAVILPHIKGVDNPAFFSMLPWVVVACGLIVFLIAWYTPDKRDDVPAFIIFGACVAFAMALARNGVQMSIYVERVIYLISVVGAGYLGRGWYLREKNKNNRADE